MVGKYRAEYDSVGVCVCVEPPSVFLHVAEHYASSDACRDAEFVRHAVESVDRVRIEEVEMLVKPDAYVRAVVLEYLACEQTAFYLKLAEQWLAFHNREFGREGEIVVRLCGFYLKPVAVFHIELHGKSGTGVA